MPGITPGNAEMIEVGWWPGDGNPNDITGSNHGTLVNGATFAAGLVGQAFCTAYAASKFALEGWSESLRIETRALGIRVVLVEPGSYASCSAGLPRFDGSA